MSKFTKTIRGTARQLAILAGVIGLTFAAGIEWAEAAETGAAASGAMPGEVHVVFLFLVTLGGLAIMVIRPQERATVRGRSARRHITRR